MNLNWLQIIQLIVALSPEVLQLIAAIAAAFGQLPAAHQQAVIAAVKQVIPPASHPAA